uniref:Uncharacterized protein n=1 Tax=Salmonella enterica subsp. indica TaxID=59207 RepID=I3W3W8_SALER|nr:hypothetical protein [Salmonella enterica subsp. indica]
MFKITVAVTPPHFHTQLKLPLLNALVEHHVLRQDRGRYFLGLRLYKWGTRSLEQFDISKIAR